VTGLGEAGNLTASMPSRIRLVGAASFHVIFTVSTIRLAVWLTFHEGCAPFASHIIHC
jgi:hypothetical protein